MQLYTPISSALCMTSC